jgi:aminopeptidase N
MTLLLRLLGCLLLGCLLLGAALFSPSCEAGEDNDPRVFQYDALHYDLTLAFNPAGKSFSGSVSLQAEVLTPTSACVLSASNETLSIDSVVSGGRRLMYRHERGHLVITLPASLSRGEHFQLTVMYHGSSGFRGAYDDGGVYFSDAGRIASSSEPQFSRRWWPCKDLPSDKATVTTTFTVPAGMTAVSNGILERTERHGRTTTYWWRTRYPIATYLVSIAAAVYAHIEDTYVAPDGTRMPLSYYVFPEDSEKALVDFKNTKRFLDFLGTTVRVYPFLKEKFGYAEVEGNMTMENQTISSIQNALVSGDGKYELTIFHETAHQWWGDLITTADWHHTWLNEGFASYAEALYREHTEGRAGYERHMNAMMAAPVGMYTKPVIGVEDTAFWDSFGPSVYFKGAIVLHMLRGLMGDSVFFRALREYTNNPALQYANARTEDFQRECERVGGHDLGWFFRQWVFTTPDSIDRPMLSYSWKASDAPHGCTVAVTVRQEHATARLYRLPFPIVAHVGSQAYPFAIVDSLAVQTFSFPMREKPDSVLIDPGTSIFKHVTRRSE